MQRVIRSIFVLFLLGFFTVASAQETSAEGKEFLGVTIAVWPLILTVLSVAWMTWGEHIMSSKLIRNIITVMLSVGTVGSGVLYVEKTVEKTVEKMTIIDTLELKEMQENIIDSMQVREMRLDNKIDSLQESVREKYDSTKVHLDRHYRLLKRATQTAAPN